VQGRHHVDPRHWLLVVRAPIEAAPTGRQSLVPRLLLKEYARPADALLHTMSSLPPDCLLRLPVLDQKVCCCRTRAALLTLALRHRGSWRASSNATRQTEFILGWDARCWLW
jgi:hypothetical protein